MARSGYVYFIQQESTDYYKIGVARNPESRLCTLRGGNPNTLNIALLIRSSAPRRLEKFLHELFQPVHIRREWFEIDSERFETIRKEEKLLETVTSDLFMGYMIEKLRLARRKNGD